MQKLPLYLLLLLLSFTLGACSSGETDGPVRADALSRAVAPQAASLDLPPSLPGPAELAAGLTFPAHAASYLPQDLFREGTAFDPLLPQQNTVSSGNDLSLTSTFGQPGSPGFSGAAYAGYRFVIPDYAGNSALSYSLATAPQTEGNLYLLLANWETMRWDAFKGNAAHKVQPASLTPYFLPDGTLLATALLVGVDKAVLSEVRVGSRPPDAVLTATPGFGTAPMTVSFSAGQSTDPDGSIVQYRWDPEGDGVFDLSTGADPHLQHEYTEPGQFDAAVRVFDDQGVYGEMHASINTSNHSFFSYGGADAQETANTVVACVDGHLMCFGTSRDNSFFDTEKVVKFSPEGSADLALSVPLQSAAIISDAVLASDGFIYVVGSVTNGGLSDALLQKWTQDGELIWTRTLGGPDDSENFSTIAARGDKLYLSGSYFLSAIGRLVGLACSLDTEANPQWFTSVLAPGICDLRAMVVVPPTQIIDGGLALTGTYGFSVSNTDALYAFLDFNGNLVSSLTLGESDKAEKGMGIGVTGGQIPDTYITGLLSDSNSFLSRFSFNKAVVEIKGNGGANTFAKELVMIGGLPNVLFITAASGPSTALVAATFDGTLAQTGSLFTIPDGSMEIDPFDLIPYGNGNFVAVGNIIKNLPAGTGTQILTISASSLTWDTVTPSSGSPTTLVLVPQDVTPVNQSGYEFNREQVDQDMFVLLDQAS